MNGARTVWPFTAKCPLQRREQRWIEESLDWFVEQFGDAVLRGPVRLPTAEFFPAGYAGSVDDVQTVLARLCVHMGIDANRVVLEFVGEDEHPLSEHLPQIVRSYDGSAGHWQRRDGRTVVALEASGAREPVGMVATLAHELAHERLLGEERVSHSRRDHEPLTDLLTVFFGLGIFSANAAFEFRSSNRGWQARRLGYLTEPMYGYALARYAWLRAEPRPEWARYLDTNPRTYLKRGLRYLRKQCQQ